MDHNEQADQWKENQQKIKRKPNGENRCFNSKTREAERNA